MNLKFKRKILRQWRKALMLRVIKNMREQYEADRQMRIHYNLRGQSPMKTPLYVYAPTLTVFREFCGANSLSHAGPHPDAVMIRGAADIKGLRSAPMVMTFAGHCFSKADQYMSEVITKALLKGDLVDHTDNYITND